MSTSTQRAWPQVARLMEDPAAGHQETLREILQQPETWRVTARQMERDLPTLAPLFAGLEAIILTGSGSSEYAGECARPALRRRLGITAEAIDSGTLLTDGVSLLSAGRPALMVSFARSGDSPESVGALAEVLHADPTIRHLALTCNAKGQLAKNSIGDERVKSFVLDERTNDRSLVMTSSFTNMVLAALGLAWKDSLAGYSRLVNGISESGDRVLEQSFKKLAPIAQMTFHRAFFLASALTFGAARESALKMTEMTAGRVMSTSETYLGVRHGPMSAIDAGTVIVCFLSSNITVRSYECDLIEELTAKGLGMQKVIVGSNVPRTLLRAGDVVIEDEGFAHASDESSAVLHVLVGQVLAFFRCMHEGLQPDAPSEGGVIHRVVQKFKLQGAAARSL